MTATHDAVITIEPGTDGRPAVVEHYRGETSVIAREADCPFGLEAAARAWAEATGAAYERSAA